MNTQVLQNQTIIAAPSTGRLIGAYLEETRCEALRLLRNPGLVIPRAHHARGAVCAVRVRDRRRRHRQGPEARRCSCSWPFR